MGIGDNALNNFKMNYGRSIVSRKWNSTTCIAAKINVKIMVNLKTKRYTENLLRVICSRITINHHHDDHRSDCPWSTPTPSLFNYPHYHYFHHQLNSAMKPHVYNSKRHTFYMLNSPAYGIVISSWAETLLLQAQNLSYWSHDSLCRQPISTHDIKYVEHMQSGRSPKVIALFLLQTLVAI